MTDFEKLKADLIAFYESEGDDPGAMNIGGCGSMGVLTAAIIHDLRTAWALTVSAGVDAEEAIQRAKKAEGDLESATQPLDAEMAKLNKRVTELNDAQMLLRRIAYMHRNGRAIPDDLWPHIDRAAMAGSSLLREPVTPKPFDPTVPPSRPNKPRSTCD